MEGHQAFVMAVQGWLVSIIYGCKLFKTNKKRTRDCPCRLW